MLGKLGAKSKGHIFFPIYVLCFLLLIQKAKQKAKDIFFPNICPLVFSPNLKSKAKSKGHIFFPNICPLLFAPNFPVMNSSAVYALKRAHMRAIFLRRAKISQLEISL
jgi:hypothetical protein